MVLIIAARESFVEEYYEKPRHEILKLQVLDAVNKFGTTNSKQQAQERFFSSTIVKMHNML